MMSYKHQQTSVAHQRDLRCLQQSTRKHLQQQTHFLRAIQKLRLTFSCTKFSQKNYMTTKIPFHAINLRNNDCLALVKTKTKTHEQCLLVNTGSLNCLISLSQGVHYIRQRLDFVVEENVCSKLTLTRRLFASAV